MCNCFPKIIIVALPFAGTVAIKTKGFVSKCTSQCYYSDSSSTFANSRMTLSLTEESAFSTGKLCLG